MFKIIIPGGSGILGTHLARAFHDRGDEVVVLTRDPEKQPWRTVQWNGKTLGPWRAEIDGADVVINMAGRSVNCRYGKANRREILESRVDSTTVLGQAIGMARKAPRVWLQMSTATIYAHRFDKPNDERTGILGGSEVDAPRTWRFSIEVARAWEWAFDTAATPSTRKVKMRTAVVMSPAPDSAFRAYLGLTRWGLGGAQGGGRQWMSWIHHRDFVRAVAWLIDHDELDGAVNLAAPNPLPNADFMRGLREAWGIGIGMPSAKWMLEIAAFAHRTETELLLKSRRVVPTRLLRSGFTFEHATWPDAARDLIAEWRGDHAAHTAALSY